MLGRPALLVCVSLALSSSARAQHGAPERVVADHPVGPYLVSLWSAPNVGMGRVYVVYEAREGVPFVVPTGVRVGATPLSESRAEEIYHAHPEQVRHGARFLAHIDFDLEGDWRLRVVTEGLQGNDATLTTNVRAIPPNGFGALGMMLYSLPFLAVALLRWRVGVNRRRATRRSPALATH